MLQDDAMLAAPPRPKLLQSDAADACSFRSGHGASSYSTRCNGSERHPSGDHFIADGGDAHDRGVRPRSSHTAELRSSYATPNLAPPEGACLRGMPAHTYVFWRRNREIASPADCSASRFDFADPCPFADARPRARPGARKCFTAFPRRCIDLLQLNLHHAAVSGNFGTHSRDGYADSHA